MALPTLSIPTFKTTVPSTGERIEYRPFLVKEEKILLIALEGQEPGDMTDAIKKILQSCILTKGVDVNKLATFDVEYLFLQLRAKSVGELIEIKVGHTGDNECDHKTDVVINLDALKIEGIKKDKKIAVTDTIGVVVHYPSMSDIALIDQNDNSSMLKLIASCIDMVYDDENVYEEFTLDEMVEWLEGLNQTQFEKISTFFSDIPRLKYNVEWTCKKCKKKDSFVIEGLASFFTLL